MTKGLRIMLSIVVCLAGMVASAASSISMLGTISVGEGGTGFISGRLIDRPAGSFAASFTEGEIAAFRLTKVEAVYVPGATAFFTGEGTATVRENGRLVEHKAKLLAMVDDLDLDRLPFPDQIMMEFTLSNGRTIIRHGRVMRGDIAINRR